MSVEDRQEVQEQLKSTIRRLNTRFRRRSLAAPVDLTAGDEVQALVTLPAGGCVVEVMRCLADAIHPDQLRFGVGIGGLSAEVGSRPKVAQLDGPCFHRARAAIEQAEEDGVFGAASGFGDAGDAVLGALFELLGVLRQRWTATQGTYVAEMRDDNGRWRLQREVAEAFGVSRSVVSESLKAASLPAVARAEDALAVFLNEFGKNDELEPKSVK